MIWALQISLGYSKVYKSQNPFDWMELISLQYVPPVDNLGCVLRFVILHYWDVCIESAVMTSYVEHVCFSEWLEIMGKILVKAAGFCCTELTRDGS